MNRLFLISLFILCGCATHINRPVIRSANENAPIIPREVQSFQLYQAPQPNVIIQPFFVKLEWNPSLGASEYILCIGNLPSNYSFQTNISSTEYWFEMPVDWTELYSVVRAKNSAGISDVSNEARYPDWPINAVKITWQPPIITTLQETQDFKTWTGYNSYPPVTNSINFNRCFYRATDPVNLSIEGIRVWNAQKNHFGG